MTKIHLQDAMLQLQILQGKLDASERLNKPPTKLIAIPEVLRQAGWMPIPKPLTQDQIDVLCDVYLWCQEESRESSGISKIIREVERAHGIGEKE
jgi:hypothetical protein